MKPDLEGFRGAQAKLRAEFGEDIPFFAPTGTTYPPGTPLDPESGEPYDPTILPTASGFASASVRCNVVSRPLGLSRRGIDTDAQITAIGNLEEGQVVLITGYEDYHDDSLAIDLDDATECIVHGERYVLGMRDEDQLGDGDPARVLIWADQK